MTQITLTPRQRHVCTLLFQPVDKVPFMPGHGRRSTRENWRRQGLPADEPDYLRYACRQLGIEDALPTHPPIGHEVVLTMRPEFEEKIIELRSDSHIVQDWKGNICEIGLEFSPGDLRGAPDFCTRNWLKCPVASRDDWRDMARRYDPDAPARFPANWTQRCEQLAQRDYASSISFPGPFWQLREWLGFEQTCMVMLDEPAWVEEMTEFWRRFIATMLERMFKKYIPDFVLVNEDMAYKEKPMIGPDMARRFCLPCWETWGKLCRDAGVAVYEVDSDGYVGELLPVWIEAGFVSNSPQEVAAGNDLPAYRRQYGQQMAYRGGVDKRAMAAGGDVLRREIDRLRPVIDSGGYIPSCDHGVPSDVSWPNFMLYCELLAKATGWL